MPLSKLIARLNTRIHAEGGDDDGGGGGDNDADNNAAIDGLKRKNSELLGEKKKATARATELSNLFESLGGEDGLTELKALKEKIDGDAILQRVKNGEFKEVLNESNQAVREALGKAHAKELAKRDEAFAARDEEYKAVIGQRNSMALSTGLSSAADASEGFHPTAKNDAAAQAAAVFNTFNPETGQMEATDKDGVPVLGEDGKTPLTMGEWLEQRRETHPHWWASSQSGDLGGSIGNRISGGDDLGDMSQADYEKARMEQGALGQSW